jgi:hypothetical protein
MATGLMAILKNNYKEIKFEDLIQQLRMGEF